METGPLLTDKEFFSFLDYSLPSLENVKKAAENENFAEARKLFAAFARGFFDKEKFFSIGNKQLKPTLTNPLKATAERALRHEMWSCGTSMKFEGKVDWFANPTYNGYKEWPWQLSRHSELYSLAEAYRACGDERYAEGCAELFDSWVKQAVRPGDNEGSGATICWRTIECGIRMGSMWPDIIHSFISSPAFTDDIVIDWCKSVYEHCDRMRKHPSKGNWLIHELDGLVNSGVLYSFFKDAKTWRDEALGKLLVELDAQVYPDGYQFELTTRYQTVVISHYMSVIDLCKTYNVDIPAHFLETVEKMMMIYVEMMQSSGCVPDINDGLHETAASFLRGRTRYFPGNEAFKYVLSGGKEGKAPDHTTHLFEYAGQVVFRTGWTKSDISAFFDAGIFGEGHQHEDKLNFLLYAGEKNPVCEANCYSYDTSDIRSYSVSTRGHNTVRVNGLDQNTRKNYVWKESDIEKKAENVGFFTSEDFDYADGFFDGGYGPEAKKLAVHKRSVIFVKKPKEGKPYFIVTDRIASETENEYEIMWHFKDGAEISENAAKNDDVTAFFCGDTGEKKIVSAINGPAAQGWYCESTNQGDFRPLPTLLHTVKGKNVRAVTLFSVNENGASPIKEVISDSDGLITVVYKSGICETVSEKTLSALCRR